jgi:glycosyltransferase involved in cell wall biosynthesis
MKILFITDNFPPHVNSISSRSYEHCREWVKQGVEVTVITCAPNFPDGKVNTGYTNKWIKSEMIDGIKVIRIWTFTGNNERVVKIILDCLSFLITSFIIGLTIKTDIIVSTSPQNYTAITGRWLSLWKRKRWVMEVHDLCPEYSTSLNANRLNLAFRFFKWLEKNIYKHAHKIVVVTDAFSKTLIEKYGIAAEKISIIKNGVNLELYQPQPKNENLLVRLGLENKFIIGYIGPHGLEHALDFVLYAAKDISDPSIHFLLIGSGTKRKELLKLKNELQLENVTMLESISNHEMLNYTSIFDVALLNLRRSNAFLSVIPSKIFELAAMHKPILLGIEGEAAAIIDKYQVGFSFIPENRADFYQKIKFVKMAKFEFSDFLMEYDRKKLANKMLDFIRSE